MKIRGIIFNGLDLDKYYPGHNPKQHSRGFSRQSDTLSNAGDTASTIFRKVTLIQ